MDKTEAECILAQCDLADVPAILSWILMKGRHDVLRVLSLCVFELVKVGFLCLACPKIKI